MADNVFEYDTTAGNNTLSGSQSLAENVMKVPAINDVMRTSYAHFAAYLEDMAGKNTVGGTADAITLTTSMGFADPLVDGLITAFQAASAVTGASTINVDATGAIALRRNGDTATEANDVIAGGIYLIRYDASANSSAGAWVLLNAEAPAATVLARGQCKLSYVDSSNIRLLPVNGNKITIDGTNEDIPSAGVTLAVGSLTPNTLYYIYVYMSSGTMTLEASTTVRSTSTTTGVEIKTGDATRTFVGLARPITGPSFVDSSSQRLVRSYFHEKPTAGKKTFSGSTTSSSDVELSSSDRLEFLSFSGDVLNSAASSNAANQNQRTRFQLRRNGSATGTQATCDHQNVATNIECMSSIACEKIASDGYNYISPFVSNNGGTSSFSDGVLTISIG